MPLIKSASDKARSANVAAEIRAGRPRDQALAIAYRIQREAKARRYADGGRVLPPPQGYLPEWWNRGVGEVANAFGRIIAAPRRAMEQGITTEEAIPWAADTAMNLAGVGTPMAASGAAGIFGGRLAATADKAALAKAESMAAQGASRDDIWKQTGWFQGGDKKWRFEIPDNAATLAKDIPANPYWPEQLWPSGAERPLSGYVNHDALYQAYPSLRNLPTIPVNPNQVLAGMTGGYGPPNAVVPKGIMALGPGKPDKLTNTALHEMQHAVQNAEGFTPGANVLEFTPAGLDRVRQGITHHWSLLDDDLQKAGIGSAARAINAVQAPPVMQPYYADTIKRLTDAGLLDRVRQLADANKGASAIDATIYNKYRSVAGEVEARNVESRRLMTPEERRATPPWQTQDTPFEQQTFPQRKHADGGMVLPDNPYLNTANAVSSGLYDVFAQPIADARKALTGRMTENEARDFALTAAMGILPIGRGLQGVRMGTMAAPRAANAVTKPASAFDDAMAGVMNAMGEVPPAPMKLRAGANVNLPMDEASRMARAKEMGFTTDAYHATLSPKEFDAFRRRQNDIGIHFGTQGQAQDRIDFLSGIPFANDKHRAPYSGNARTFPAKLKLNNPLRLEDAGWWSADNVADQLRRTGRFTDDEINRAIRGRYSENSRSQLVGIRDLIQSKGYDGIVYKNTGETTGAAPLQAEVNRLRDEARTAPPTSSVHQSLKLAEDQEKRFRSQNAEDSYVVFHPNQVRSRFAVFDPAKKDSGNLLAGIAGLGVAPAVINDQGNSGLAKGGNVQSRNNPAGGGLAGYAEGGAMPFHARAAARGLERTGMIRSPIAGRTDRIGMKARPGSYVIPADTVSSIGQGNSLSGANALNRLFKMGPYGSLAPTAPRVSAMPRMARMPGMKFADGGDTGESVDIVTAGGEFIIPPEKVAEIGQGDMGRGQEILDQMVQLQRRKTISALKKLPPPKK